MLRAKKEHSLEIRSQTLSYSHLRTVGVTCSSLEDDRAIF